MNKPDSSNNYMNLLEAPKTRFKFRGQEFTVAYAPAPVFDSWARQFYDEIINVNPLEWGIHDRWQLVNDLLQKGIILLLRNEGEGSARLVYKDSVIQTSPYEPKAGGTYSSGTSPDQAQGGGTSGEPIPAGGTSELDDDQGSGTSPEVPTDRS